MSIIDQDINKGCLQNQLVGENQSLNTDSNNIDIDYSYD